MPKVIDVSLIHKAALDVFSERGYEAATTKEIARRAGVNEVTLYRRFGTKAELIKAALGAELSTSPFGHLTASDDVMADITAIAAAYLETFNSFGAVVMMTMAEVAKTPEFRDALAALMPNLQNAAEIIARHQAAGRITPGNPFSKLLALIAPLAMTGFLARIGGGPVSDLDQIDPAEVAGDFLRGHGV